MERFLEKYLLAVLGARNPVAEERAWEAFYFWMVFPATDRKAFAIPEPEAEALIGRFRGLVEEFRAAVRRGPQRR